MLFKRFVQIGRVVLINYGPDQGKLATIIDVLDGARAYIDGPSDVTGVRRQIIPFKWLSLTRFSVNVPRSPRLKTLRNAFQKADILNKWKASAWAKKLEVRQKRTATNDFDRFKIMLARKKRSAILLNQMKTLKREYNKARKKPRNAIPNSFLRRRH